MTENLFTGTLSKNETKQNIFYAQILSKHLFFSQDETACQTWLQRQATMDSLGKGVALALPNARKFPYCTLSLDILFCHYVLIS